MLHKYNPEPLFSLATQEVQEGSMQSFPIPLCSLHLLEKKVFCTLAKLTCCGIYIYM